MKKILSILFLLVYINTAFGVGIDLHFCGGQMVDFKLAGFGQAHCSCPKGSMPTDCCKNELHFSQTDNHKVQADATIVAKVNFIQLPAVFHNYLCPLEEADIVQINNVFYNQCRFKYKPAHPLFILNAVFRI